MPGRAFLRRLYVFTSESGKILKPHHHIKITEEHRLDLGVWKQFLVQPKNFYRPFMDSVAIKATEIDMFSNASGNYDLGFGAYCGPEWTYGQWDREFCERAKPSIEYLELLAVLAGVLNWIWMFQNRKIILFCDNQVVVHMINKSTSSCKNCMVLIRLLVTESIYRNVRVYAKYVGTKANGKADALSRLDMDRFWKLSGHTMSQISTQIPSEIWPICKIWRF